MMALKTNHYNLNSIVYEKQRRNLALFTCILLILQSGLRNIAVGPDTYQYYLHYIEDINLSWRSIFQNFYDVYIVGEGKDAGYQVYEKLLSYISTDYQVYLLLVAISIFIPMIYFVYNNTSRIEDILLFLLLYETLFYSFFSITGIRQTVATGLCLISVKYIKERRLLIFLLLIVIACFMHRSAMIFLPFYWIGDIKNTKLLFIISACSLPITISMGKLFALQLAILSGNEAYLGYAEEESSGAYNLIIFYIIITLTGFIRYWRHKQFTEEHRIIFNAISIGLFLLPLTINSANLIRLVQYYSIFLIVFISYVLAPKRQNEIFPVKLTSVALIIALFYKLLSDKITYGFFWDNMPLIY